MEDLARKHFLWGLVPPFNNIPSPESPDLHPLSHSETFNFNPDFGDRGEGVEKRWSPSAVFLHVDRMSEPPKSDYVWLWANDQGFSVVYLGDSFIQQLLTASVCGSAKLNPGSREGWRGHWEWGGGGWAASGSQPCWAKSHLMQLLKIQCSLSLDSDIWVEAEVVKWTWGTHASKTLLHGRYQLPVIRLISTRDVMYNLINVTNTAACYKWKLLSQL